MIEIYPGIKGLIFDCDGTLVDSMPLHIAAWKKAFADFGEIHPEKFLDPLKGMHETEIVELYNKEFSKDINSEQLVRQKHSYFQASINNVQPINVVVDVAMNHYGKLPMAVVSGGTGKNVNGVLDIINIKHLFQVILTADDPIKPKPAPDIFLEAAARIDVEPRFCQVFEDGDIGLKAAIEAGMKTTDVRKFI